LQGIRLYGEGHLFVAFFEFGGCEAKADPSTSLSLAARLRMTFCEFGSAQDGKLSEA
jgi:hypothetical protein